ncbi:MAG TPA: hypothetical protein VEV87_10860 [Chitinophagaceae bacterium]|nr:hypothetical protein [Chitinophagaceae bacterium]
MKQFALFITLTIVAITGFAQAGRISKNMTLKLRVVDSIERIQYGYLAAVADSGIIMLKSPVVFDQTLANSHLNTIAYHELKEVTIKRKGSVGRGIWMGSVAGFAVGAVIGAKNYVPCNGEYCLDPGRGGQAIGVGFLGAIGGGIVGGIIGSVAKKTFIIGGKRENYKRMKESILDRTYKSTPR